MRIYKHWARGEATVHGGRRPWTVRAYGGSNDGPGDALRRARETAERAAAAIERGQPSAIYGYADRPLREEVIEEIRDGGALAALITRNAYGALVLNTSCVMFVDIDGHASGNGRAAAGQLSLGESIREFWDRLRGKPSTVQLARDERLLQRVEQVVQSRPGIGVRIYRTAGGFRLLVTSGEFDPTAAETQRLLEAFGSDPLYLRLCQSQECFRARLSAKFWRCGASRPPSRFPWSDATEEAEYRQWQEEYHRQANQYATCQFVRTLGEAPVEPSVRPILDIHDRLTILEGAPLA